MALPDPVGDPPHLSPDAESSAELDRDEVEQLRQALGSSREIGVAIGIVMISYNLGQDEAVAWLKRRSNETNVKLRELCAELIHEASHSPPT